MSGVAQQLLQQRREKRAGGDVEEDNTPLQPKAKKKKKGSPKEGAEANTPSTPANTLTTNIDEDASERGDGLPKRPATAPPAALRPSSTGKQELNTTGIILVEDNAAIEKNMEMVRLIRAPRYFDDNIGEETGAAHSRQRCFNCGELGHRIADCTNAAREKPCYLCAQLGHDGKECPSRLCFKCGRPGHMARECAGGKLQGWEAATSVCNRCGLDTCECAGKGDYLRYEGGCNQAYHSSDLIHCRCYVCGRMGHLCCTKPPVVPVARMSCYCCGAEGHRGEDCPHENRPHLSAERQGDVKRAQAEREAEEERAYERMLMQRGSFGRGGGRGGNHRYGSTGRPSRAGDGGFMGDGRGMGPRMHKRWDDSDDEDDLRRSGGGRGSGGWNGNGNGNYLFGSPPMGGPPRGMVGMGGMGGGMMGAPPAMGNMGRPAMGSMGMGAMPPSVGMGGAGGGPMGNPAAMYAQQQAAFMQGRGPGGPPYQQQQQQQGPVPMYAQAHNYGGPPRYGSVDRHVGQQRMQAPAMYGSSRGGGGGGGFKHGRYDDEPFPRSNYRQRR
uniref:CCHC-type domain-containing protein n=1 Tax=Dunaliella tertiolecta TaxID=3047 RepID=A0A7S3R9X1_DUNTE|mmetsp:Transcript_19306/g.54040  ORF Transcript_19306/g.54040 Transcript_19306/m.54040 type:complete len:554 (+) Transcript_19306:126-1787(+)